MVTKNVIPFEANCNNSVNTTKVGQTVNSIKLTQNVTKLNNIIASLFLEGSDIRYKNKLVAWGTAQGLF